MKAIWYILYSYTQIELKYLLTIALGILYVIVAIVKIYQGDGFYDGFLSTWHFYLLSLIMISPQIASQTKRLVRYNADNLIPSRLPHYAAAAGIIFAFLFTTPVIAAWNLGLPLMPHIAMLFITAGAMTFMTDYSISKMKPTDKSQPFEIALGFSLILLSYLLLGFPAGVKLDVLFSDIIAYGQRYNVSFYIFILSIILLVSSAKRFSLYAKYDQSEAENVNNPSHLSANHDFVSPSTLKRVIKNLNKLLKSIQPGRPSRFQLARMFQYSLFNPRSTIFMISLIMLILLITCIVYIVSYLANERFTFVLFYMFPPSVIWMLAFQIGASLLTWEFLQHRYRMPLLWMQSPLSSRKDFAKTALSSYLLIAAKRYTVTAAVFFVITLLFPDFCFIDSRSIPLILTAGAVLYILLISLSLIFSGEVTSSNCFGWSVFIVVATFLCYLFYSRYWRSDSGIFTGWILVLTAAVLAVVLLRQAYKIFSETEMDFASP